MMGWIMTYPSAVFIWDSEEVDDEIWHITMACKNQREADIFRAAMGVSGAASNWHSRNNNLAALTEDRRKAAVEAQRFIDIRANALFVPTCALDDDLIEWLADKGCSALPSSAGWLLDFPDEAGPVLFKLRFGVGSRTVPLSEA